MEWYEPSPGSHLPSGLSQSELINMWLKLNTNCRGQVAGISPVLFPVSRYFRSKSLIISKQPKKFPLWGDPKNSLYTLEGSPHEERNWLDATMFQNVESVCSHTPVAEPSLNLWKHFDFSDDDSAQQWRSTFPLIKSSDKCNVSYTQQPAADTQSSTSRWLRIQLFSKELFLSSASDNVSMFLPWCRDILAGMFWCHV